MLKKYTETNIFQPTPAMRVWLDVATELLSDNVSEIAKECKVSRQSWYQWIKDDSFMRWFQQEWDKRIRGHGWKLDVIGFHKARENHSYWKSMQERLGNLPSKDVIEDNEIKVEIRDYGSKRP